MKLLVCALGLGAVTLLCGTACTTRMGLPQYELDEQEDTSAPHAAQSDRLVVDEQVPLEGTLDRARDPALVLLRAGDRACSATFIAKDVVVTARACVQDASALEVSVHVSDEPADEPAAARALEILLTNGEVNEPGLGFVVLDAELSTMRPLGLRASRVAAGNRLRAAGHVAQGGTYPFGTRVVREHVRVLSEGERTFFLAELGCRSLEGAPALDPSNGQIVGILVAPGERCDGEGASNQYLRVDAYADAFDRALTRSGLYKERNKEGVLSADARPRGASRPGTKKPPSDVGATCNQGADCATGVCIVHMDQDDAQERAYCSRACGRGDRCPTNYRCTVVEGASSSMCVLAP